MRLKRRKAFTPEPEVRSEVRFCVRNPQEAEHILEGRRAIAAIFGTPEFDAVDAAVQAFFASGTSAEAEKVVKTLKKRLLSDAAIGLLYHHEAIAQNEDQHPAAELWTAHRRLLDDSRSMGIEAAFREARRGGVDEYYWDS